jgi:hypothetical protein
MLSARGDEAQTRGDWLWNRKKRGKEERSDHQMKRRERQEKE